jgi:hypothetical protein
LEINYRDIRVSGFFSFLVDLVWATMDRVMNEMQHAMLVRSGILDLVDLHYDDFLKKKILLPACVRGDAPFLGYLHDSKMQRCEERKSTDAISQHGAK